MSCYQDAAKGLRQAGLRMTPQRLMVMEAVFHHEGHITAEEVHAKVQTRYPYVDLSTVYRTLQVLKEQHMVAKLHAPDGPTQYEALLAGHHHHAVCLTCGAELELSPETLDPIREQLLAQYGFRAELTHMVICGVCRACAEQEQRDAGDNSESGSHQISPVSKEA